MGEHNDFQHVFEGRSAYRTYRGHEEVRVTALRCGCGTIWHRADTGEEWQEDKHGVRRPAPRAWLLMQQERERARNHAEHIDIARRQQRAVSGGTRELREGLSAPSSDALPELATIDPRLGRRDVAELGVWDDRWWHYEVTDDEILVFHLDPGRRGAPVWRFPAGDVPYAPTA